MNLVSIVIPIYNEQDNIEACIDVLNKQTNQNFNVIFVDDGSIDESISKLKEMLGAGVKFNYTVLTQRNLGAAAARKKGVDNSLTEFIMILDCDDKLSDDLIDQFYTVYTANKDVDIVIPNMYIQNKNCDWIKLDFYTSDLILNPIDCLRNSLDGWRVHGCFAIRKSIFQKSYKDYAIYNNENFINNDEVITRLNFYNSKVIIRSQSIYYYCYNSHSTTKRVNSRKYLMINNALILKNIFLENVDLKKEIYNELISVIWENFRYMNSHKSKLENLSEWDNTLKDSLKKLNFLEMIKVLKFKRKIQLGIMKYKYLFRG